MANVPLEFEAARRRSWFAVLVAVAISMGAVPALDAQLGLGEPPGSRRWSAANEAVERAIVAAPTTTIDPAVVGVHRLTDPLDTEHEELGAVGFRTGATVVVVTAGSLLLVDLDADIVGIVEPSPLGELLEPLDTAGRDTATARTSTGTFSIDAAGIVSELGLDPRPADTLRGSVTALCGAPCDRYLVRPIAGGSWTASFGGPVDEDAPRPAVSNDGGSVAAWVSSDSGSRLEIADATDVVVVPFSNEGPGRPVMTAWAPEGDGVVYAKHGESRLQVFSLGRWATGSVWLDDVVVGAAVLPVR